MTKLHLKYVQSFGGYHYFRRRGMPRIPLPGIVGSPEFMAAYQQALAAAPVAIGASTRSKAGSVSAAIAEYYGSQAFRSLAGGTRHYAALSWKNSGISTATKSLPHCRGISSSRCSMPCRGMLPAIGS